MDNLDIMYFAVVTHYDFLSGTYTLQEEELLLDEEVYYAYANNDEDDDTFIHWDEKWEVKQRADTVFEIVHYDNLVHLPHQQANVFFKTKHLGQFKRFDRYLTDEEKRRYTMDDRTVRVDRSDGTFFCYLTKEDEEKGLDIELDMQGFKLTAL